MDNPFRREEPHRAARRYWGGTLLAGVAILGVVAALLEMIARTADEIDAAVAEVWRVGKLIANNTVHIPLLVRINQHAAGILGHADRIAAATTRIERKVTGGEE